MVQAGFRSSSELPLELSVSLLSVDRLFWAQSSSLVIAYCQEALPGCWICLQIAPPSPSPGGGPTGGLAQGKAPGIWGCLWLSIVKSSDTVLFGAHMARGRDRAGQKCSSASRKHLLKVRFKGLHCTVLHSGLCSDSLMWSSIQYGSSKSTKF